MKNTLGALFTVACIALTAGVLDAQEKPSLTARESDVSSLVNVRLDLAITDETAAGEPVRKMVSLLLANEFEGRVRSKGTLFREPKSFQPTFTEVTLNADARIARIEGDRILAMITVEYSPADDTNREGGREKGGSTLNQSVSVVLTNAKPTVIVESSDPLSDRKVTLEATATIQR